MDSKFVDPLRQFWRGKQVIQGTDTPDDARLALDHGFDGLPVFQPFSLPLHLRGFHYFNPVYLVIDRRFYVTPSSSSYHDWHVSI